MQEKPNNLESENLKAAFRAIDGIRLPIINVRRTSNLAASPVNFLGMAMGLFMFSCPMMKWCAFTSPTLATAQMFGGICQYILGIYDWYQGKTVLFFTDFLFGLTHLSIYYSIELVKYGIKTPFNSDNYYHSYMVGTFFALLLATMLILLIVVIKKGIIFIISFLLLIIAIIFMMVWQYNEKAAEHGWAEKTSGYFLFFTSLCLWLTGLLKMANEILENSKIPLVVPSI